MKTFNGIVKSALLRTKIKECINRRQKDCKASFSRGLVIHQCGADIAQAPFPDWEILMSQLGWESRWKFPLQSCKSAQATTARVCCFTLHLGLNWWSPAFFFYLWGRKKSKSITFQLIGNCVQKGHEKAVNGSNHITWTKVLEKKPLKTRLALQCSLLMHSESTKVNWAFIASKDAAKKGRKL